MTAANDGAPQVFSPRIGVLLTAALFAMFSSGCTKYFKKTNPTPSKTNLNLVETVDATIDLQLMPTGSDSVTDTEMMDILAKNCSQCHGTGTNLDLTHIPADDKLGDIQWRVNLSSTDVKRMPMSRVMDGADLTKMNTWLKSQLSPSAATQFAGYQIKLSDTGNQLVYEVSSSGRGRFQAVVRDARPSSHLALNVAVLGPSGSVLSNQTIDVELDNRGYSSKSILMPAADTVPPVVQSPEIIESQVTQSSVNLKWAGATDGSSTAQIRYKVYRSDSLNLDTSRDMELNGARVGDDVTAGLFSRRMSGVLRPITAIILMCLPRMNTATSRLIAKFAF